MVTPNNPGKRISEFNIVRGSVTPVKVAGSTTEQDERENVFTLANLQKLGDRPTPAPADVDTLSVDIEVPEYEPSVQVDSSVYEEADRFTDVFTADGWKTVRVEEDVEGFFAVDPKQSAEVLPWNQESEEGRIDLDSIVGRDVADPIELTEADIEFFGETVLEKDTQKQAGYSRLEAGFFVDEGRSLKSAKRRAATRWKDKADDAVFEISAPYSSMQTENRGRYDLATLQKDILYDFVERNLDDLSKASGLTGILKRRKLKKKLHDLTRTAACWHLRDENDGAQLMKAQSDYASLKSAVFDVFDTIASNKNLAAAYRTDDGLAAAKEAVDIALVKYASPLPIAGADKTVFNNIGDRYVEAEQARTPSQVPAEEPASAFEYSPARKLFNKAAAVGLLVATSFGLAGHATHDYSAPTRADDSNIQDVDKAEDVFVSYATTQPELANAETPVEEPAPQPRRNRRARGAQEETPEPGYQLAPDAHLNPQPMPVGQIDYSHNVDTVDDAEVEGGPTLDFRTRTGARMAALAQGTPEWDYDDSNLRLAPAGEGHDYTSGGSEFRAWTEYQ